MPLRAPTAAAARRDIPTPGASPGRTNAGIAPLSRPPTSHGRPDLWLAAALALGAGAVYLATASPDWTFDALRYADWMQRGAWGQLIRLQHALGNAVPLGAFRLLRGFGYGGGSLPVLAAVNSAAAGLAVALLYLAARRLGGHRSWSFAVACLLAVAPGVWRAGASAGVYGIALAATALGWLAAAQYVQRPSVGRAAAVGLAAGIAVATQVAAIAFAPAGLLLVARLGGPDRLDGSLARRVLGYAASGALGLCLMLLPAAGLAAGWSPEGMLGWLLHPRLGGPGDLSGTVGFGLRGLFYSLAGWDPSLSGGAGLTGAAAWVATCIAAVALWASLLRGLAVRAVGGRARALSAALILHASLAVLLASWYQALRADYFTFALVPLALLWACPRAAGLLRPPSRRRAVTVAGTLFLFGVASNLLAAVVPVLHRSELRDQAAATVIRHTPADARLIVSKPIMPRIAYAGFSAQTGWEALAGAVAHGSPPPGLDAVLRAAGRRGILVSSAAFDLRPQQAAFLRTTPEAIWESLRACCAIRPVATFSSDAGAETLYLLTRRPLR